MVGVPVFAGFISKLMFANAAVYNNGKMLPALVALAVSTILNAIYFMKTVIRIYTPARTDYPCITWNQEKLYAVTVVLFMILNVVLGMNSQPIVDLIKLGLSMFA